MAGCEGAGTQHGTNPSAEGAWREPSQANHSPTSFRPPAATSTGGPPTAGAWPETTAWGFRDLGDKPHSSKKHKDCLWGGRSDDFISGHHPTPSIQTMI